MTKLTDAKVRNAKPAAKKFKLADGHGLTLVVLPTGTKSWQLRYRVGGKAKEAALGSYPATSIADARKKAAGKRGDLEQGKDPSLEKRRAATQAKLVSGETFLDVAEAYMAKRWKDWSLAHAERFRFRMQIDVFPLIGDQPINQIEALDIVTVAQKVLARADVHNSRIYSAKKVMGFIGEILAYGVTLGLRKDLINTGALAKALDKTPAPIHRLAITSADEFSLFVRDLYATDLTSMAIPILKMALHTGQRSGEIRNMRWDDIDWAEKVWNNPVTKIGSILSVPLTEPVLDLLHSMRVINGNREHVFAGDRGVPISDVLPMQIVRKLGWADRQTMHGLRASFRTMVVSVLKCDKVHAEAQLSHASKEKHGRAYDRAVYLDERREMMADWSGWIEGLRVADGNVVALGGRGR